MQQQTNTCLLFASSEIKGMGHIKSDGMQMVKSIGQYTGSQRKRVVSLSCACISYNITFSALCK